MLTDYELDLSHGQAVTADAASANVVDLKASKALEAGEPVTAIVRLGQTFNGVDSLTIAVEGSDDPAFGSGVVTLAQSTVLVAALRANTGVPLTLLGGSTKRYLRGYYTTNSTLVKAQLSCATLAAHHLDTVLQAHTAGAAGNAVTVALTGDSGGGAGVTIARVGSAFTIHYESGVSTVGDVETAVTALAGADDLVDVKTAGTGATVLTAPGDNFTTTALGSGSDAEPTTGTVTLAFLPGRDVKPANNALTY